VQAYGSAIGSLRCNIGGGCDLQLLDFRTFLGVDQSGSSLVFGMNRVEHHIDPRDLDRDRERGEGTDRRA
jgi:hypothetical protein